MSQLISLGNIIFESPTLGGDSLGFETLQEEFTGGWVSQGRLSRDPAMQFTGPGAQTLTLAGRVYPKIFGGIKTLEAIKLAIRDGKPLSLIRYTNALTNTNGMVVTGTVSSNKYVIMKLSRAEQKISPDGTGHRVDFQLDLQLYGDDLNTGGPLSSFL
jgi:hypothetical protein